MRFLKSCVEKFHSTLNLARTLDSFNPTMKHILLIYMSTIRLVLHQTFASHLRSLGNWGSFASSVDGLARYRSLWIWLSKGYVMLHAKFMWSTNSTLRTFSVFFLKATTGINISLLPQLYMRAHVCELREEGWTCATARSPQSPHLYYQSSLYWGLFQSNIVFASYSDIV